jgi:predicted ATP-grasp superfamily ATP-dependent carboligase
VETPGELADALRLPGMAGGALVQEFVPGRGEGVFLLVDRGVVRARFAHRRLREKPPAGGVSVVSESRLADPDELAACERLVGELGWHGLAMLEFRRTPDGRAVLMELNPRLWGSVQLAIDAGVDFPGLLVELARGAAIQAPVARAGVRTRWLLGDLDHVWIALRRPAQRRALGRSVWGVLAAFVASFFDGTRLEVWRRDDPRPFWRELRERLR